MATIYESGNRRIYYDEKGKFAHQECIKINNVWVYVYYNKAGRRVGYYPINIDSRLVPSIFVEPFME